MNIELGALVFGSVKGHLDLVAEPVAAALEHLPDADSIGVSEIDPGLSDTAAFCEKYGIGPELAANCVVVEGKRGEERKYAACMILANTRADVNGLVRKFLDTRKVSFASRDMAVAKSGMEFGAITPIGLPPDWTILIDRAVVDSAHVIVGSGIRNSKLTLSGSVLATLPNVHVIEGLGMIKTI